MPHVTPVLLTPSRCIRVSEDVIVRIGSANLGHSRPEGGGQVVVAEVKRVITRAR